MVNIEEQTPTKQQVLARLRKLEVWTATNGDKGRDIPDDLYDAILALHCCPNCASFPEIKGLLPLKREKESYHDHGGWECWNCEEFWPEPDMYQYHDDGPAWSDADPGL